MIRSIKLTKKLKGKVLLPASKSYSIRAFIIAACGGKSRIINPSNCDDALVAKEMAGKLGLRIRRKKGNVFECSSSNVNTALRNINVGESGTVLRFVLPLASLAKKKITVSGRKTLIGRPNKHLNQALRNMGVSIKGKGVKESVPIVINGGEIKGGKIAIDGSLSSQFISALLITCPKLDNNSHIILKGKKLVSSDYITMTMQVLKRAGIRVQKINQRNYKAKGSQKFKGLKNFTVPSDFGLAAFHMAAAALVESDVTLKGKIDETLVQADGAIFGLLRKMGVRFKKTSSSIKIKGPFSLKGGSFSLKNAPDLVPIMAILALFAKNKTHLTDIQHARIKESDRISDLRKELIKIGAQVKETTSQLIITPQASYKTGKTLDPHNDHRLAMAFSVLGLKVPLGIRDSECIAKSYPDFFKDFKKLGGKLT